MAYPTSFLRFVAIGTLYQSETFSWSCSFARNFPEDNDGPDVIPQGVIDAAAAFHASDAYTGVNARLTALKLNLIGTNGRYVSQADTVQHEFEAPVPGLGSPGMPPQSALAVTLRTEARRGRANSGRFYLPKLGGTLQGDGRIAETQAADIAVAATTFLDAMHVALPGWRAAVMSDIGEGTMRFVTHVEVGRVVDTIRSRRTSLDEDRQVGQPLAP